LRVRSTQGHKSCPDQPHPTTTSKKHFFLHAT
jgi:hypothetical protein